LKKATLLNSAGYAAGNVKIRSGKGKVILTLPANAERYGMDYNDTEAIRKHMEIFTPYPRP